MGRLDHKMIGKRLAEVRKRAGLTQVDLAVAMGDRYNGPMISMVENNHSAFLMDGAVNAARELNVSLDYLAGLTDDPTPASQRERSRTRGKKFDDSPMPAHAIDDPKAAYETGGDVLSVRPVEVNEVAAMAGGGAEVFDETVVGRLWFRNDWLDRHAIDPTQCNVITVRGESMEPTLPNGCSILVDRSQNRRRRREDRIYVMRTNDGLVVKRAHRDKNGRWQLVSDHAAWKAIPWSADTKVIGEVRWLGITL